MNRRDILIAALAAPIATMPLPALASSRRITWQPGTLQSPYAALAGKTALQLTRDGVIYTTDEFIGHRIKLIDPSFVVAPSDILFHPTRGFRYMPSLELEVYERGVLIGRSIMASNGDYEAYYEKPKPADQPDFWFRSIHTPYDNKGMSNHERPVVFDIRDENWKVVENRQRPPYITYPALEEALGKDAVDFDDRLLRHFRATIETAKARVAEVTA